MRKVPELYPLARLVQGKPQSAQIRVEDLSLQKQLDGSWALSFGRSTLIFSTETHAKLAETWLKLQGKSQVKAAQLMNLKLPQSEADCEKFLILLAETEEEIANLQKQIKDGEAEVDEKVSELYGLNASDRKIIREFLERF